MARKIRLKPIDGLTVIDPKTGTALPAEGKLVDDNPYWARRKAAGEVEFVKDKQKTGA